LNPGEQITVFGEVDSRLKKDYIQSYYLDQVNSMRYSTQIKPISYLKANAAEVLEKLAENRQPLIITQNGEAKAVMQDLATYENTQETLALLKVLALGQQQIAAGKTVLAVKAFADLHARLNARKANEPPEATPAKTAKKRTRRAA
jgi:prevent-host-death family protein